MLSLKNLMNNNCNTNIKYSSKYKTRARPSGMKRSSTPTLAGWVDPRQLT